VAAVSEVPEIVSTFASVADRVLTDARRSFGAEMDVVTLEKEVQDVLSGLWSDSTRVTTFIPVLALRELRDRLGEQN
jgi:hypothetical protein